MGRMVPAYLSRKCIQLVLSCCGSVVGKKIKKLQNKMWQGKAMKDHPQQCTILTGAPVYIVCGYSSFQSLTCHAATGTDVAYMYRITQCYLPPGRGDISTFYPSKSGTSLVTVGGCKAELTLICCWFDYCAESVENFADLQISYLGRNRNVCIRQMRRVTRFVRPGQWKWGVTKLDRTEVSMMIWMWVVSEIKE